MTLILQLSPDAEAKLRERAAALGQDVQTFVLEAVQNRLAAEEPLEFRQAHEAIREGIADMEAGRVAPLSEVCARIRAKLQLPDVA